MSLPDIRERICKERLFFDGGTGTILQEKGLKAGELPETWNITHPDDIVALGRSYLAAGADIINTNTFGANALKYPDNLTDIVTSAVACAREARRLEGREDDAYVALDMGPTGKLLAPMGDLTFEDAVALYAEVVRAGVGAGADLILIETMSDSYEAKAAVLAAKENSDLPVFITLVFDETGKMLTGGTPESAVAMLEGLRVDALGVNCSLGPAQMLPIVERLRAASCLPLIVNPNAGLPRSEDGRTVYDVGPEEFAGYMAQIAALGAQGVGGCCGTGPAHIEQTIAACRKVPFVVPPREQTSARDRTVVSSFAQAVTIGERPVIVGERINPTGKKRLQEALRSHNLEYILAEGLAQEEAGADVLDINVGLPEIDEPAVMEEVIQKMQGILALPLQIDTSDMVAMERAMRLYNGKPMINSVNGKKESMEAVFPLVQKYGGVVVALLLDEGGIPDTVEGRLRIAEKIYATAAKYGIAKKDIVVDALAMAISSGEGGATVTLETLRRIRDDYHGNTILGVSNISFGLPYRQLVNAHFFTMAMQYGLSCAIIDPSSDAMIGAYRAFLALSGQDDKYQEYVTAYQNYTPPSAGKSATGKKEAASSTAQTPANGAPASESSDTETLHGAVERGLDNKAAQLAATALETGADPLALIDGELIPALDRVGQDFEKGTLFLPQLLMSAEAAKAAFAVVQDAMKDTPQQKKDRIILATVKGDIHDIGKNIVKVLLENYGYDVLDLGKDVDPQAIVDAAKKENIRLVGLSALMTTTVASMEETIDLLRAQKPDTKVVVGGAVMNEEYAAKIGADGYGKDAMATVRFADSVFAK